MWHSYPTARYDDEPNYIPAPVAWAGRLACLYRGSAVLSEKFRHTGKDGHKTIYVPGREGIHLVVTLLAYPNRL